MFYYDVHNVQYQSSHDPYFGYYSWRGVLFTTTTIHLSFKSIIFRLYCQSIFATVLQSETILCYKNVASHWCWELSEKSKIISLRQVYETPTNWVLTSYQKQKRWASSFTLSEIHELKNDCTTVWTQTHNVPCRQRKQENLLI